MEASNEEIVRLRRSGRSDHVLQLLRLVDGYQRVFDGDPAVFAELSQGSGDGLASSAGHRSYLFVGQQQRKAVTAFGQVLADLVGQFEKQASQACGHGLSQRNAARILQGKAVFLADALNGAHLRLLVIAQEALESL